MVFLEVFKVNGTTYGWIFAGLSIGFIGSSQLNNLLLKKFKSEQIIVAAVIVQTIATLIFVVATLNGWLGIGGTICMIFIVLCCVGITNPNASALSLAPFAQNAGTAAALLGAIQLGLGAVASFGISFFDSHSALPMAGTMAFSASMALIILLIGRRFIKNKVEASSTVVVGH